MLALLFTEMIDNNIPVMEYINKAKELWKDITLSPDFNDDDKIIKMLDVKQHLFELSCGGNQLGKIIFPLVGIGQYHHYNKSFDSINDGGITDKQMVSRIISAFKASAVSQEVKFTPRHCCVIYSNYSFLHILVSYLPVHKYWYITAHTEDCSHHRSY